MNESESKPINEAGKPFELYVNYTDEFEYDFVGRLGVKTIRCKLCNEKLEIDMPFKTTGDSYGNQVILDDKAMIEHYEQCHPEYILDNKLGAYTGQKGDRPCIIVLNDLTRHQPTTIPGQEYYHIYILRNHKESPDVRLNREREEHNTKYNPQLVGQPIQEVEHNWRFLASNIKPENVGSYIKKRIEEFKTKGIIEKSIVFKAHINENNNISILYDLDDGAEI